jgi:TonB family protein
VRRVATLRAFTVMFGILCGLPARAEAEAPPNRATPPPNAVTPPRLKHFVEAVWPAAEPRRPGVSVLLEITVDADGRVVEPTVIESAGPPFDRAAEAAVSAFEFAPALQGTTRLPARLRYRYEFRLVPETTSTPPEAPEAPPPDDSSTAPARPEAPHEPAHENRDAAIATQPAAAAPRDSSTDGTRPPDASPGVPADPLAEESYAAVAQIEAPPREVTRRTIEQQDLTKIPGTSGDALRAIEVMPGVARTSISSGDPILRGAAWHESRSYVEGATVPQLFHLGGVKSAFNSRLLSRVDLYPSNYGTTYGRGVGGVVSAKVRDPQQDRLHALAEASVIDSMALVETPIGSNAAVALAGRRSNIDLFYNAFAPKSSFTVAAAPVYYDYQGLGWIRLHARHQLRILSYGSHDGIRLVFANPSDFDPALRDQLEVGVAYHRVQTSLESELSSRLTQRVQLTYGYTTMRQVFGATRAEMREHDLMSRGEWNYRSSASVRVNLGYDLEMLTVQGYYIGNRPPQAEGEVMNGGASTESVVDLSNLNRITAVRPAAYAEVEWRPVAPLLVVPGIRVDHYSDQGATTVNPRLSSRFDVHERFGIKWGVGTYSQNPQYYELIRNLGNPRLRPYHALQYSAGFEHRPTEALCWGIEGFYKWLYRRVVSTPGGQPPYFLNDGVGRIYGAELFARYTGTRLRGWLAYTLSRSERQDRADPWRLFEQDQTHILAATANYRLGRGWEVGGRFRLTSGNPYTPVRAAVYDASVDAYRPVNARPFSARNPTFHQLDLRIEKTWEFIQWRLACFLDVQNVYNATNNEGFDYSYDYAKRQSIPGLSFLPNLGLRGEL